MALARPHLRRARPRLSPLASRVVWSLALAVFSVVGVLAAAAPGVSAADWSIREVVIDATVGPDGSMAVTETRTFTFPADFRWVEERILLQGCRDITRVAVREGNRVYTEAPAGDTAESPGTFRVVRDAESVRIRFWFPKQAGSRTFTLSYLVTDAVIVHSDVAELYWKFIGPDTDVGMGNVIVDLHLPEGASPGEVRAWAHGPLQGTVDILSPSLVRFEVADVPRRTFVEGRVTFPVELALSSARWDGREALPGILAEEARWARQANRERLFMRLDLHLSPVLLVAALSLGWWLMARYGREHRPADRPEYYRDLPEAYSPAELGVLWRFGSPAPADFVATILDLARRGFILIEEVRGEHGAVLGLGTKTHRVYRIWRRQTAPRDDTLRAHEKHALDFLFSPAVANPSAAAPPDGAAGRPVLFSDVEAYSRLHASEFRAFFRKWVDLVKAEAKSLGFFDEASARGQLISAVSGAVLLAGGALLLTVEAVLSGVASLVAGVGLLVLTAFLSRRSVRGCREYWLWRGFRNYLHDFSRLEEAAPPALALWDHFLVYAVSLGVAKEVIRQLPLVYGEANVGATVGRGWLLATPGPVLGGAVSGESLSLGLDSLASFAGALTTSLQGSVSSATGSGGGFSGGGGGGGGGGGVSAGG